MMLMELQKTAQVLGMELPPTLAELRAPVLEDESVHLWHASPAERDALLPYFSSLLSADEEARRQRFHFESDQRNFSFARGMLRTLLAAYSETSPRELRFEYSELGKPSLAGDHAETELQFNLSHTPGAVLLAVCRQRAVGVDVERVREDFRPQEVAARFFSTTEQRTLMSLPEAQQREAFFRCWTRKEAFLKARGSGLSFPLAQFDVSIAAGEAEVSLTTRPDAAEAERWQIMPAPAPEGCEAAVAVASAPGVNAGGKVRE
jgi:4'-phosphopantetheinyl transferase